MWCDSATEKPWSITRFAATEEQIKLAVPGLRLLDVGFDVGHILEADGQADVVLGRGVISVVEIGAADRDADLPARWKARRTGQPRHIRRSAWRLGFR